MEESDGLEEALALDCTESIHFEPVAVRGSAEIIKHTRPSDMIKYSMT